MATAPLQLPLTVLRTSAQKNVVYGTTIGAVRGVGAGVGNVVTGTVQVVSAVIPPNPLELIQRKLEYINGTAKVATSPLTSLTSLLLPGASTAPRTGGYTR